MWTLTGFADEVPLSFKGQLRVLTRVGIQHVDLRHLGRTPVLEAKPRHLNAAQRTLDEAGIAVASIATTVGKVPVTESFTRQLNGLKQAIELAHRFGTPRVRIFSNVLPRKDDPAQHRRPVLGRMDRFADLAADEGITLLLENEATTFASLPTRTADIARSVDADNLRLIFDPVGFLRVGVRPTEALSVLRPWVSYLHVKDARKAGKVVVMPGTGEAQLPEIVRTLATDGFTGTAALEPAVGLGGRRPASPGDWQKASRAFGTLLTAAGVQVE